MKLRDLRVDDETGFAYLATGDLGIFRSVDGVSWSPLDRYCLPVLGFSDLTIVDTPDGKRWLVAGGSRNTVLAHEL